MMPTLGQKVSLCVYDRLLEFIVSEWAITLDNSFNDARSRHIPEFMMSDSFRVVHT